jgi:hypothetical protein
MVEEMPLRMPVPRGVPAMCATAAALGLLLGCEAPVADPEGIPQLPSGAELGAEIRCADPYDGFDRFVEEASLRGLDVPHMPPTVFGVAGGSMGGSVVVQDVDGDGDLDVLTSCWMAPRSSTSTTATPS